jgi:hypothetical protein
VVLRYGFGLWAKEKQPYTQPKTFTIYKDSGYVLIWSVFVFVILIETFAMHYLLLAWSTTAALVATCLSMYGLLFFLSDLNAVIKRPIAVGEDHLLLRVGYRWRCEVKLNNIIDCQQTSSDSHDTALVYPGATIKSGVNLMLRLNQPVVIERFMKKDVVTSCIVLSVDERADFVNCLKQAVAATAA